MHGTFNWQRLGYEVKLIFLRLPSADVAIERVKARVISGGHNIPEPVIRRRFDAGLGNFHKIYRTIVNSWILYDNLGETPTLIAAGSSMKPNSKIQSSDPDILGSWPALLRAAENRRKRYCGRWCAIHCRVQREGSIWMKK